jgi:hypothetical protein
MGRQNLVGGEPPLIKYRRNTIRDITGVGDPIVLTLIQVASNSETVHGFQ